MRSALFAIVIALAACGSKAKPQLAPLPDDPKPAEAKPAEPPPPPPPPAPLPPLDVTVPAQETTVKLISKGRGQPKQIRYPGKAGDKQKIELALDFGSTESMGEETQDTTMPTLLLSGEVETKAVDNDGIVYALAISAVDLRDVPNAKSALSGDERAKELPKLKEALSSLGSLVIGGRMGATGAPRELALRIEKPDARSAGALEVVQLTMPSLPVLPKEAVALGAKWKTTMTTKLAGKIEIKVVTDYEVTAAKGSAWTIRGKTAISGADQTLETAKISKIKGSGTSEMTLGAGLFPAYKSKLDATFSASNPNGQTLTIAYRFGGEIK